MPDSEIKSLLKRLGETINTTLMNSPEIHDRIREIRNVAGFEVFLTIETKIGYCCSVENHNKKTDDNENEKPQTCRNFTEYDEKFLKTLKIAIN